MANTTTNILEKILARGLLALREQCVMPRVVNGDYGMEAAEKGDTIDVPIAAAKTAVDVTPAVTVPANTDSAPTKVQISLNKWKKSSFYLTDKEVNEIDRNKHFIPLQVSEAIRALANKVNTDLHAEYLGVYGYYGTAGTTPFASTVEGATKGVRKILNLQRAPKQNRRGVLDFDAEANALTLAPFSDAEKIASNVVKVEGELGRKYGIDWFSDDNVVTHTHGTLGGTTENTALINDAAYTVGETTVDIDNTSLTGTVVIGDIFTVAGDTQTYVCTATATASANAIAGLAFLPASKVAWADDAALVIKADHVVNLGFHRDAFAFANRPLVENTQALAGNSDIVSQTDPDTGISLRLEVSRQYKQTTWEFDILYGVKLVRADLAMRLAG